MLHILHFLYSCFGFIFCDALQSLKIGCLLQESDSYYEAVHLRAALDVAKDNYDKMVADFGYEIEYHYEDSGCNETMATGSASDLVHRQEVHALIGPSCDKGCIPVGYLAADKNMPMISFQCSSATLSHKHLFPTFGRTRPYARETKYDLALFINHLLGELSWEQIGVIYSLESDWSEPYEIIVKVIGSKNFTTILPNIALELGGKRNELMKQMKEHARVIMFLCQPADVAELLTYAYELDMYSGEYAFIAVDFKIDDSFKSESWYVTDEIFAGVLSIDVLETKYAVSESELFEFDRNLKNKFLNVYHYDITTTNETYYDGAPYIYDAMKAYLMALKKTLEIAYEADLTAYLNETKIEQFFYLNNLTVDELDEIHKNMSLYENGTWSKENATWLYGNATWIYPGNWSMSNTSLPAIPYEEIKKNVSVELLLKDGLGIMRNMFNSSFIGMTGAVHIKENGDRYPVLTLTNLFFDENGKISKQFSHTYKAYEGLFEHDNDKLIIWPSRTKEIPLAPPKCGFYNELCQPVKNQLDMQTVLTAVISPFLVVAVLIVAWRMYKRHMYEIDLLNDKIIFKFKELEIPELILKELKEIKLAERLLKKKKPIFEDDDSDRELITPHTEEKKTAPLRNKVKRNLETPSILAEVGVVNLANGCRNFVGRFRLDTVHVKQIPKCNVYLSRDVLVEMKDVRDLIHPNLNSYAGFCTDSPHVLILSGICQKGSLLDILQNEDIQLNWVFRLTFAMDIATGLAAIHESPITFHGHLTSHNILIDSRWNCKISDYGLRKFKATVPQKISDGNENSIYTSLLWTAPESIGTNIAQRTKEGDIYSFGIIVSDIINRLPPFSVYTQYKAREIIHFIHKRCIPPFRPHVRLQTGLDGRVLDLMRQCWDEFPSNRPTIQGVKTSLKTIMKNKSNSANLLDNMIEMMEKYSQGLEIRIRELNHEKDEEKTKLEKVLYKSLPMCIAKQLRGGHPIIAENFYEASVLMFSVDAFTSFISLLSPQQVIDLLHDVYQIVDEALSSNVHKIKVLRDCHTLVCGMPEQGIKKHAYYIARTALNIMGSLTTFRFRHIDDELMRFKIAIHSGSFLAGVVGRQIPVYTVLGKALDYAEAVLQVTPTLRILVTKECSAALGKYKGIDLEPAGPVMVKGFGFLEGDFLVNMQGLRVKLRPAILAKK